MAKQNIPFWDLDVTKMMSEFRFPGMDIDAAMAAQRRNIEALTTANQLAMEGMQSVARRQMEVVRQSMEEMASMATALMSAASPEQRLARQADLAKSAFERTLCAVTFDLVTAAVYRGFSRGDRNRILCLLAMRSGADAANASPGLTGVTIDLDFAGSARIRLVASALRVRARDFGDPWPTPWQPGHELNKTL